MGWRKSAGGHRFLQDDRLVSPQQSRILAAALPGAATHFVPGQGHLLLAGHHAKDALQSALSS